MTYDGVTLTMTIRDTVTQAQTTQSFAVDIPGMVGGTTAYVGFGGGTGGLSATQEILSWTYTASGSTQQVATPAFGPAGGTYTSIQSVTISDATAGAQIYYTTDGSTPTTASTPYSGPIGVTRTTTIKALAVLSGWTNSAVASATYTLQVVTPTFSPGGGTYASAQSVTIADATPGAQIYYTTDGSTPTSSSSPYTGPVSVTTTTTLKAIAVLSGWTDSAGATATYTMTVATPTFSPDMAAEMVARKPAPPAPITSTSCSKVSYDSNSCSVWLIVGS